MSQIAIYDPHQEPFGPLSNNYEDSIVIDGKIWNTLTNYIYEDETEDLEIEISDLEAELDELEDELADELQAKAEELREIAAY